MPPVEFETILSAGERS